MKTALVALAAAVSMLILGACTTPSGVVSQQVSVPSAMTIAQDGPCCGPITPKARHLLQVLNTSDLEDLWQARVHVAWDTGKPDLSASDEEAFARIDPDKTHCSAYAAAMAQRMGVYILRPPSHDQKLLASAQGIWLGSGSGRSAGWWKVDSPEQAQALANSGRLVVVVYVSPEPLHHPGHIAIVLPNDKRTLQQIEDKGVLLTYAGKHNLLKATEKHSFSGHPGAFPNEVKYFAHDLPDQPSSQSSN